MNREVHVRSLWETGGETLPVYSTTRGVEAFMVSLDTAVADLLR